MFLTFPGNLVTETEWPGPPEVPFPEGCVLFAEMAFMELEVICHRDSISPVRRILGAELAHA